MNFFRKKDEVFLNTSKKPQKEKRKKGDIKLLPEETVDDSADQIYDDSFLLPETEQETLTQEKTEDAPPATQKKGKKLPKSEVPFYRNRNVLAITSLAVAGVIAFVFVPLVSYLTTTDMTDVVRVIVPVAKGQKITAESVSIISVPTMGVSENVIESADEVVGRFTTVDLSRGDYLTPEKMADTLPFPNDYLYQIPMHKMAVSVSVQSFASGLSGKLLPGDVVSIFAVPNQGDAEDKDFRAIPPQELTYIKVLAVTDKLGTDQQQMIELSSQAGVDRGQANIQDDSEEQLPATITFLCDAQQAACLAGLEVNAKLHVALASRGDSDIAQDYLDIQDAYLELLLQSEGEQEEDSVTATEEVEVRTETREEDIVE